MDVCIVLSLSACRKTDNEAVHSAYYWSTTFQMSARKADFIHDNQIKKLYMRFFDVVMDKDKAMPNATIEFIDTIPSDLQVIPTVFITNECMAVRQDSLPQRIVNRVMKMCDTHDVPNVKEIQIDCDWTKRTQAEYFRFLETTKKLLNDKGMALSVTIRLHQLSMTVPPADRGVLMVYNTGDLTDAECENPILDIRDVKPYLESMSNYRLPMAAAYPIFSWNVLRRGNTFVGIQHYEGEWPTLPGDKLITVRPTADEIIEVKNAVTKAIPGINNETILFDLSDKNLMLFSDDEFNDIYGR